MDKIIGQMTRGEFFDIHQLHEAIILGVKFDFLKNFSQHIFLLMKAKIRRFGKEGVYYEDIDKNIPGYDSRSIRKLVHKLENQKIKREIKSGKIKPLEGDAIFFMADKVVGKKDERKGYHNAF